MERCHLYSHYIEPNIFSTQLQNDAYRSPRVPCFLHCRPRIVFSAKSFSRVTKLDSFCSLSAASHSLKEERDSVNHVVKVFLLFLLSLENNDQFIWLHPSTRTTFTSTVWLHGMSSGMVSWSYTRWHDTFFPCVDRCDDCRADSMEHFHYLHRLWETRPDTIRIERESFTFTGINWNYNFVWKWKRKNPPTNKYDDLIKSLAGVECRQ